MADDGLIAAYLRELRFSVARLADADDIVAEAEDHLLETVDRLSAAGRGEIEAQSEALARFGSASLVARICISQAKQGAAVPTTRTRHAGLAGLFAPLLLLVGQVGNVSTERGALHGLAVAMLASSFPAFAFGLWGLRSRHGGLGPLGRAALLLVLLAPAMSLAVGWAAPLVLVSLVGLAVVVFGVEMLRASVLPVAPLALVAAGGVGVLTAMAAAGLVTALGGDAGQFGFVLVAPLTPATAGFTWLGWHLWCEPAANDATRVQRLEAG